MSDRWCDDCSWPYECAAAVCCRRREAGEIRSAAPAETAEKIGRGQAGLNREIFPGTRSLVFDYSLDHHLTPKAGQA